jgi:hypothetical protein
MSVDQDKLHELLFKAVTDFGATYNSALVVIRENSLGFTRL